MNVWFLAAGIAGFTAIWLGVLLVLRWRFRFDDPEAEQRVRRMLRGLEIAGAVAFVFLLVGLFTRPTPPPVSIGSGGRGNTPARSLPVVPVGNFIRSTYPRRSTGAIARNAKLILWFKKPIDLGTLLVGQGVRPEAFTLIQKETKASVEFSPSLSADGTIVVLAPKVLLGNTASPSVYEARVNQGLKTRDGEPVANPPLVWDVVVDAREDHTVPTILARFPDQAAADKNAVAQVTFSQAMNPLSVFASSHMVLNPTDKATPEAVTMSEDFRSVEVFGGASCGLNACGRAMRCFTGNTAYTLILQSLEDVNGNTLASGAMLSWKTLDRLNHTAPAVVRVLPKPDASGVALDSPVFATFSSPMLATSLLANAAALPTAWLELAMLKIGTTSQLSVFHPAFSTMTVPIESILGSDFMSTYQQCFAPCIGP